MTTSALFENIIIVLHSESVRKCSDILNGRVRKGESQEEGGGPGFRGIGFIETNSLASIISLISSPETML